MTLILALDCADGLLLASDGQATVSTGGQPVKTETEKLHRPWSNIGWGSSGLVPVSQLVEQALAKNHSQANVFERKTIAQTREGIAATVTTVVRKAITEQHMAGVPNEPQPYTDFLFVGHASDGPFMLEIHKNLLHTDHIKTGYAAIGSGDIFPYYSSTWRRSIASTAGVTDGPSRTCGSWSSRSSKPGSGWRVDSRA